MEEHIRELIIACGDDPQRPGLEKTPSRVSRMYKDLTSGTKEDARAILGEALFPAESDGLVVCQDIDFVSMCEHHMLPFFGRATIAYLPDKQLVGISKLVRLTQVFARRLQVQERMGQQILDIMDEILQPCGSVVHISATHLCMVARGVKQPNARMVTLHRSGQFEEHPDLVRTVLRGSHDGS
jgi:GTP cyclohydrolase IA